MRDCAEAGRRILDFVCVSLPAPVLHGKRAARGQIIQGRKSSMLGLVTAFGLGQSDQIIFHADDVDGLRRRSGAIRPGFRKVKAVSQQRNQCHHENSKHAFHAHLAL